MVMVYVPEPVLLPNFLLAAVDLYSCSGDDSVLLFWQWLKTSPHLEERSGQEVWGIVPFLQELLFPSCMPATPRSLSVLLSVSQSFLYGRLFLGEESASVCELPLGLGLPRALYMQAVSHASFGRPLKC